MDLSRKHLRLLKKISKTTVIRTDKNDTGDIDYLLENNLVTVTQYNKDDDFFYQPHISEKGKAVLDVTRISNKRANIAIAISIFALIISIAMANLEGSIAHHVFKLIKETMT